MDLERGASAEKPDDERHDGTDNREPRDPGRPRILEHVVEVSWVHDLEKHAGAQSKREEHRPDEPGEHAEATCEREREGEEPRRSARLRDRDEIGER